MDSDTVLIHHIMNPCCAALKEKYSKLEASRKALREGVKIQNELIDKLQKENLTLKKAHEEEKVRVDDERQEKYKESAHRVSLEKEIDVLKSEIHALHQRQGSRSPAQDADSELLLLRTRHAEMEAEIANLKELVEEEKVRADSERQDKSKESADRVSLEKEIDVLKSEIHSLLHKEGSKSKVQDVDSEFLRHAEMETEIDRLKVLLEEEKARADAERLEKSKESANRVSLEKEIDVLKAQMHSLHQREGSQLKVQDNELLLLRTHCAEMEAEIDKLKELVEKERMKADCDRRKADEEKKAVIKAHEALKVEKNRSNEKRRLVNAERKKVEESRILLEKLKSEAEEARSQLVAEALKSEEMNQKLQLERHKVLEEKLRADAEMGKAEKQKQLADMYQKKAMDEKCRADHLSQQLEEHKQKIQNLRKQVQEHVSWKKLNDSPANPSDNLVNSKAPTPSSGMRLDILGRSPNETTLVLDDLMSEKVYERLREEKEKVVSERKRADSEMNRAEQLKKVVEVIENKALEEKYRADQLARQLEDHTLKIDHLQKELSALALPRSSEAPVDLPNRNMDSKTAELEMMKKHLKLKKKQVQHAKEVAKLERDRADMLHQKLGNITHEFVQFLHRINVLDDCFMQYNEGRDKSNKNNVSNSSGSNLRRELLGKSSDRMHFHQDNVPVNCSSSLLPASGRNSTQCVSGKRCFGCYSYSYVT